MRTTTQTQSLDLIAINEQLENATPQEILRWAWRQFGTSMGATSSFQTQSVPLLHMMANTMPAVSIFFLDTGFHFPQTLSFRDSLVAQWKLRVEVLAAHETGPLPPADLHRTDPDLCCRIRKVEPLKQAKAGMAAWISGIRRDQTDTRRDTPIVSQGASGQYKICPLANWTSQDIWRYINQHDLPVHPLMQEGYMSIGCAPCTRAITAGEDERSGRWAGQAKTECGLHTMAMA